jgi:hypothetical protein
MEENLDVFFSGLDRVTAVFNTSSGTKSVIGYFDNAFYDTSVGDVVLDATQPRLTCKAIDVKGVARGDSVKIKGVVFSVVKTEPDDSGTTSVCLAQT